MGRQNGCVEARAKHELWLIKRAVAEGSEILVVSTRSEGPLWRGCIRPCRASRAGLGCRVCGCACVCVWCWRGGGDRRRKRRMVHSAEKRQLQVKAGDITLSNARSATGGSMIVDENTPTCHKVQPDRSTYDHLPTDTGTRSLHTPRLWAHCRYARPECRRIRWC